jgi:hypothetical protein
MSNENASSSAPSASRCYPLRWRRMDEMPDDGDSIWIAVLEWNGNHTHVDYAVAYTDVDGMRVKRYEQRDEEPWPPKDGLAWMPCEMPDFVAACPFCGKPILDVIRNPCCQAVIDLRDQIING